jgi:hypothetical protein
MMARRTVYLACLSTIVTLGLDIATSACLAQPLPLQSIRLPSGFEISLFADNVPNARSLALGKDNTVFVGTRTDKVHAVKYKDGKATQVFAAKSGMHFGYPYCHQGDLADPQHGAKHGCGEFTPPAAKLGPHVAALGIRFYTGNMFPTDYRNNIIVAEHGS